VIDFAGSGGGTRTPDTRIMIPRLRRQKQVLAGRGSVKSLTRDQWLSSELSNRDAGCGAIGSCRFCNIEEEVAPSIC
jgi:hypothetical protein